MMNLFNVYSKDIKIQDMKPEQFNIETIGGFGGYLALKTTKHRKKGGEPLSMMSICGHFSCVKTYYEKKFVGVSYVPDIFSPKKWKMATDSMMNLKKEQCAKLKKPLFGSIAPLTEDDRTALASLCLWGGNLLALEFLHLNGTMFCTSGRGSEVRMYL